MAASNEPHQLGSAGNGRIGAGASAPVASRPSSASAAPSSLRSTSMREPASPVQRFADLGRPDRQDVAATAQRQHSMRHHDQLGQTVLPLDSPAPSSSARQEATVSSMARRVAALPTSQAANAAERTVRGVLLSETRLRWAN